MVGRVNVKITTKNDKTKEFLQGIAALTGKRAFVGVPAENDFRQGEPIGNAALAYIHEFGSPAANIPARPFLRPGIQAVQVEIEDRLRSTAHDVMGGDTGKAEAGLNAVGLIAQTSVQKAITDGDFAPLAASTLAARRSRGFMGTKPLIETGALRQAIRYVIRKV